MTAQQDEFAKPGAAGESFDYNDYNGALLVFQVVEIEPHIPTVHTLPGEKSPAVRADMYVLDGPKAGDQHIDALVFPKVLQSQLKRYVGRKVLGRLVQGEKKPGKSAPWQLAEATESDTDLARAWSNKTTTVSAASAPSGGSQPPF